MTDTTSNVYTSVNTCINKTTCLQKELETPKIGRHFSKRIKIIKLLINQIGYIISNNEILGKKIIYGVKKICLHVDSHVNSCR